MIYVALLRGINVGGKAKVDMRQLKTVFEKMALDDVTTYINSGNVLFATKRRDRAVLTTSLEHAIATEFGFDVDVLLRTGAELRKLVDAIPGSWTNDSAMKCDVHFLWPDVDRPSIVGEVPHDPSIEDVRYVRGALIRRVDRDKQSKSPMTKLVGTPLYKKMTARNINTVRKLLELARA